MKIAIVKVVGIDPHFHGDKFMTPEIKERAW